MSKFEESNFYKALQDFFINNNKDTFLQMLSEFYNRTEGIIDKNKIQDELIKELRELYLEFNEKGIDENIVREKVNYFLENSLKIKDIIAKLTTNTNKIEDNTEKLNINTEKLNTNTNNIENINTQLASIDNVMSGMYTQLKEPIFAFSDDDGNKDILTTLKPISEELGIPFTIYSWLDSPILSENYSDCRDLQDLYGYEFGYHTQGDASTWSDSTNHQYAKNYKESMEYKGFRIDSYAYGLGKFNDLVVNVSKNYFSSGLGAITDEKYFLTDGFIKNGSDLFRSKRIYIASYVSLDVYKKIVDIAIKNKWCVVFFQHSNELTAKPETLNKLKEIIKYIQSKNVKIMTVRDMVNTISYKELYKVRNINKPYLYKNFITNPKFEKSNSLITGWTRYREEKISQTNTKYKNGYIVKFLESGTTSDQLNKIYQTVNVPNTNEKITISVDVMSPNISAIDGNYQGYGAFMQIKPLNSDGSIVKTYRMSLKPPTNNLWFKIDFTLPTYMKTQTSQILIEFILVKNGELNIANPKLEIGEYVTVDIE